MTERRGVDRRRLFLLSGTALAAAAVHPPAAAAAEGPGAPAATPYVTIHEGTNIAVAPSPDGSKIAFDLFGSLWLLPIGGGPAARLTDEFADAAMPDWTPDGRGLVFQSYRDGNFHIWMINADGAGLKQLTFGPYDCREPKLSPDGRRLAYASDRTGSYAVHVLDLASGQSSLWSRSKGQACQPAWSPDGQKIVYVLDRTALEVVDAAGVTTRGTAIAGSVDLMSPSQLQSPAFTPDGKDIVYHAVEHGRAEYRSSAGPLFTGEDVFPFRAAWLAGGDLLYTADGKIKRRSAAGVSVIEFTAAVPVAKPSYAKTRRDYDGATPRPVVGIGSPALSPDGTQAAFRALNALWLMSFGARPKAIVDDGSWVCDPAWSPDGKTLAYSCDRGGKLDIWLRDLASGAERQLTRHPGAAVSSAWSRDGGRIAFLDQTGALHVAETASGAVTRVFGPLWEPGKPSWSADGKTIAYAAFKPYSARFREGLSEILTVEVATGEAHYQPVFPNRSLGTRGDDGPVWSPDGTKMAFVFASRLHVAPVDAQGRLTGEPQALNNEVTDAPTWSGDGSKILYLSNGRLRLIEAKGGAPRTVPHQLTWAAAKPKGRVVVRAGRLWQGLGPEVQRDVDVVIEDNRIADLLPGGTVGTGSARLVDARDASVIPGLVEMHAHRQMQGYGYGDREGRLWLSLGVTSTRSPGSPCYHMVEDREALDAGRRIGPRYFSTGEAVDGSRIFYNFMRPVTEPGQMALELERAQALGYDLLKTYVRLPLAAQKEAIAWAHAHGMPVTGHYHYPAIAFGADGMEHVGATSRLGYSRSVSLTGVSYQDVTGIFVQSGARRTPTLFQNSALYGTDRSLVDDPRIKALYPPWEYARLAQRAEQAAAADNSVAMRGLVHSVDHLKAIIRNGGRVVSGTDSPIDFNGVSYHMNLRGMVIGGMTPYEALITATRFPGEYLEQPIGVIQPGMLADLVVTEGDPLTRIEDAAAVRLVVKNGQVLDMATILGPFAGHAQAAAEPPAPVREARRAPGPWWHETAYVEASRAACCQDPLCAPTPAGRRRFVATEV